MSTPSYLGLNQPPVNAGGWLGRLGSYFGSNGTPPYAAAGQPATANAGVAGATPIYAPAPSESSEASASNVVCACMRTQHAEATDCPIDPQALAAGQIAIVIPRQGT